MLYSSLFFFFNDTATTEIYTLSLHDALPIFADRALPGAHAIEEISRVTVAVIRPRADRKSTRLNSSHLGISYAVFCLKKKKRSYNTSVGYDWRVKRQRALSDKSALEHAIDSV